MQSQMVKQRPLLMQTDMVQATYKGLKTNTRRTRGLETVNKAPDKYKFCRYEERNDHVYALFTGDNIPGPHLHIKCPYGKAGDIIWVKETWGKTPDFGYVYKADQTPEGEAIRQEYIKAGAKWAKWKPSIHMPYAAARLFLRIIDIRVERLQDINQKDAIAEGVRNVSNHHQWYNYLHPKHATPREMYVHDPIHSFQTLWDSINGPGSFDRNEWIWVITFEKIEKPVQ